MGRAFFSRNTTHPPHAVVNANDKARLSRRRTLYPEAPEDRVSCPVSRLYGQVEQRWSDQYSNLVLSELAVTREESQRGARAIGKRERPGGSICLTIRRLAGAGGSSHGLLDLMLQVVGREQRSRPALWKREYLTLDSEVVRGAMLGRRPGVCSDPSAESSNQFSGLLQTTAPLIARS